MKYGNKKKRIMLYLCLTKHHKGERWHSSTHPQQQHQTDAVASFTHWLLYPITVTMANCRGGWTIPRTSLDMAVKRKILKPDRNWSSRHYTN